MAKLKTLVNDADVGKFIDAVADPKRQADCLTLLPFFQKIMGESPKMWGDSIIGYGLFHYKSTRSKQEGDWPITGFSPRKQALTIYIMAGLANYQDELKKLGKFKTGSSCLYVKSLSDIDLKILETIVRKSIIEMRKRYPG